ncbi:hypothetical protein HYW42_03350 [Candidatus Daviesbacteria bacterium]|nr:hypothetical protein [Candidatus Daviesbacteria bacterium]
MIIRTFLLLKNWFLSLSKIKKILIIFGIFLLIFGSFSLIFLKFFTKNDKEKTWVFSQSLVSSLAKQQALNQITGGGPADLDDLIRLATSAAVVEQNIVEKQGQILLTTGSFGQVVVDLPQGIYKLALNSIPGIDFTGVPERIIVYKSAQEVSIGTAKGSGKVKAKSKPLTTSSLTSMFTNPNPSSNLFDSNKKGKLVISLFYDRNGNGVKNEKEKALEWAGVIISLKKI